MFENYLLNPFAIHHTLTNIAEIQDLRITIENVEDWIEQNKWSKKFINQTYLTKNKDEEGWLIDVDGTKFLASLFSTISQNRLTFDKIKHSISLCEWIIENSFEDLDDIKNTLSVFLK